MKKKDKKNIFEGFDTEVDNNSDRTPLSEEERKILRSEVGRTIVDRSALPPHDTSAKAELLRFIKRNKAFSASVVAIALLLVISAVIFTFVAIDMSSDKPCTDDFLIKLGEESYKLKYKDATVDGVFYIDIRPIAEYAELTISGSSEKIKFTGENGTYMQFENGYDFAKVNGDFVELGGISTVTEEECIIPFKFLSRAVTSGLLVKIDEDTNVVTIHRKFYDAEHTRPSDVIFSSGSFELIENNPYLPNEDTGKPNIKLPSNDSYPIDITSYLEHMDTEKLLLVNKDKKNHLSSSYVPKNLVSLGEIGISVASGRTFELEREAAYALKAMMEAMVKESSSTKNTFVTSAYRSYTYQENLYERYVSDFMSDGMSREQAEAEASTFSARPGESEHQSGLCVDFMTSTMSDLDESFEDTDAFRWLSENAHLYGFILRFPEGKEDVTGYKYEPWHYRFVGREAAIAIYNGGLCLEEYLN
jgi:D-alanyl-D-alanine carboxypeptidase